MSAGSINYLSTESGQAQCSMLRVSRAGYYAWVDRPPSAHAADDRLLATRVREIHELTKKRYGAPRVQ